MTAPAITAWAIKARNYGIDTNSVRGTKKEAIEDFEWKEEIPWKNLRGELGYRCVKVQITEMGEGK